MFCYVSDLHTEFEHPFPPFDEPRAPVLLLAGDVGRATHENYARLIAHVASLFERVLLVAGNHEYYGTTLEAGDAAIRAAVAPYPNVTYLQNEAYHFEDGPSVFGGTFWTRIPPLERSACLEGVADYTQIVGFTPEVCTQKHEEAVAALQACMDAHPMRRWVVLSHHIPKRALVAPRWRTFSARAAFACDVDVADDPRIVAWVYGHTHTAEVQGKFHCNPVGYPGENPRRKHVLKRL